MYVLSKEKQILVLSALVDGNSERAAARIAGCNRETVGTYGLRFGQGAARLHDRLVRDLSCSTVQVDEIWSFCSKKQKRVELWDPPEYGDLYTFTAFDQSSKLVISYLTGKRTDETTRRFITDLRSRLIVMPAMTSDGWAPYIGAIRDIFGPDTDYGQLVKNYSYRGGTIREDHRYEPPRDPFITRRRVSGAPDVDRMTTTGVERNNGTMRHMIGRQRRLCYAFSKDAVHHAAAWSLCVAWYNFAHIVRTTRMTPAMRAGIVRCPWDVEEFYEAIMEAPEVEKPVAVPLLPKQPETTSRPLPGGRGFLRVVPQQERGIRPPPPKVEADDQVDAKELERQAAKQLGLFDGDEPNDPEDVS
jgi:IS1 family transposase